MVCRLLQRWADTNVTFAFEDVQVIPPFFREETDDTDDTYVRELAETGWKKLELIVLGWNRLD